jgi:ParB-like chromosome segregation protein Spo0J
MGNVKATRADLFKADGAPALYVPQPKPEPCAGVAGLVKQLAAALAALPEEERIDAINDARAAIHEVSPLKDHPVDLVRWVKAETVYGNDYNPNNVAPPEMKLLAHSIRANGYTMPIVTHAGQNVVVVVDGFHRNRIGKDDPDVRASVRGRLPVTQIRAERADEGARIAATVEHNRARGEHRVEAMSEVVRMLYQAGWRDEKIQEELGMEIDEVRRLKQITGLAELFADREFSKAWEVVET